MLVLIAQITSAVAALFVVVYGLRLLKAWGAHEQERASEAVLLSVKVSKDNEKQPIVAEQIFSILHGTYRGLSWVDRMLGRTQDRISFEIANVDEQIHFYIHTPRAYQHFVENQIYAQYPDVEIAVVPDYAAEPPADIRSATEAAASGEVSESTAIAQLQASLAAPASAPFTSIDYFAHAVVAELGLTSLDLFPIKRYGQFEDKLNQTTVDPLNGITSTIAKLPNPADRAMIQIVARPLGDDWRKRAMKYTPLTGKNLFFGIESLKEKYIAALVSGSTTLKIAMLPLHVFAFIGSFFSSGGEEEGAKPSKEATVVAATGAGHDNESAGKASADKVSRLTYEVSIRIAYVPATPDSRAASLKVREIVGSFKQFNQPHLNGFAVRETGGRELFARYQTRAVVDPFVLNVEEMATLYHMPNDGVRTPNIAWVTSKKLEPPINLPNPAKEAELTALGKANYRGVDKLFGIRTEDRRRHVYIIGKTGMGKSTLLENMILSDIKEGKGVAVVDPHGDLAEHILDNIPSYRTNDVIVFDPSDRDFPVAFNMLENIDPQMSSVVASGLVGIFKKLYADSWGPRLEHILRNTILSLLEYPGTTMLGIPRMLVDQSFRRMITKKVTDPVVKRFWIDEFEAMQPKQLTEAVAPIQNKVGQFLSSSIIRNIVGQPKSMIDLRFAMDTGKIVVCNLSKGKIGEDNSSLLGSMLITKFQLDAMSRANIPEKERRDFYLYVDEFQNFATDSFATILSEARKYRLSLTMANQYIAQMSDEVKEAVFGNVGTVLTFQVGFDDAEYISKQFSEVILPNDLVQMPKYSLYAKLLVDGMPTQPFSAMALPPINDVHVEEDRREKVVKLSRERYAQPRAAVEDKINRWSMSDEEKEERKALRPEKKDEKKELPAAPADATKKSTPPTAKPAEKKSATITPSEAQPRVNAEGPSVPRVVVDTKSGVVASPTQPARAPAEKKADAAPTAQPMRPREQSAPASVKEKTVSDRAPREGQPQVKDTRPAASKGERKKETPLSVVPTRIPHVQDGQPRHASHASRETQAAITRPAAARPAPIIDAQPAIGTPPTSRPISSAAPMSSTQPVVPSVMAQPMPTLQSASTPLSTQQSPASHPPAATQQQVLNQSAHISPTPSAVSPMPQLSPAQQHMVEQYTIYYQQHYHLAPAHARHAALTAVMQQSQPPTSAAQQAAQPRPVQAQPLGPTIPQQTPVTQPVSGYQPPSIRPTPTQPPMGTIATPRAPTTPLPSAPPPTPEP